MSVYMMLTWGQAPCWGFQEQLLIGACPPHLMGEEPDSGRLHVLPSITQQERLLRAHATRLRLRRAALCVKPTVSFQHRTRVPRTGPIGVSPPWHSFCRCPVLPAFTCLTEWYWLRPPVSGLESG